VNVLATSSNTVASASGRTHQPPLAGGDQRIVFLGDDADGTALEVMAIETEDGQLLVIHAMGLRSQYGRQYEEAGKWRR